MSINAVAISGNLTRDAELRMTQSGTAIVGFGIAVNDRRRNSQTGEWEDYANFVDCTMFGSRAEKLQPYLQKGAKVAVFGKLRWSQWEKDGQKRSKIEVIVDEIDLMNRDASRSHATPQADEGYGQQQNQAVDRASEAQSNIQAAQDAAKQALFGGQQQNASVYDEDIPF